MDKEHVFFENYADTWDRDRKEDPRTLRRLLDLVQIGRGAAVLDVGCGTGVLIPYLQECVGEEGTITALDYSRQMLDKAREKFGCSGNVSFMEGDILKCRLPEQAYDAVMCLNVYPHISRRSRDFIRQVRASLRDGGSFVIMHDMGRKRVNSIHDGGKEQRLPLLPPVDVLEAMLIGAGFTVVAALDTDEFYFVKVIKAQELPYIHYHDGDDGDESGAVAAAGHGHRHSHKEQKVVLNRLARISGHLEAIRRMVEDERDCSDILVQLAAVDSAIVSVSKVILKEHIDHCIVDAVRENDLEAVEKLKKAISTFIK